MFAEILTIGDELCRGEIVDTNSSWCCDQLWQLGIEVRWTTSCRDHGADMTSALTAATARADVVICSGGLGPTEDDLTVDVVAALAGVPVARHPEAAARMAAFFAAAGRDAPGEIQFRQVRVPAGAHVWLNPTGLAPGFWLPIGGIPVVCLPGVPREVYGLFEQAVRPWLVAERERRPAPVRIARRIYRVFGIGESQVSLACRGLIDGVVGATIHYQVKFPETLLKLVVTDPVLVDAEARLDALDGEVRRRLAPHLYGSGEAQLAEVLGARLTAAGVTVATAESCTGGLVGELMTRVPGCSRYYLGGAITYADAEKSRVLGVGADTLATHGAVSEAVVREMAIGARERFAVDLAVAVSGVAGPGGGTVDKPVGTVHLAVAHPGGVISKRLSWPSSRDMVRTLSAWWALALLGQGLDAIEVARTEESP